MYQQITKYFKIISLVIFTFSIEVSSVLARSGGGESFGGGGYDSGSSSGGSSWGSSSDYDYSSGGTGGGSSVGFWILVIIIVLVIIFSKKGGNPPANGSNPDGYSGDIKPTNQTMSEEEIKENLKKLKEIDPQFDMQKFKTHAKKVFMAAQEGWTNRDQKVCRPFMSEEIYQSHQMQIDNMKKNKTINVLENIVVGSSEVVRIELGEDYHKIAMRVRASMKDYKVKEDKPEVVIEGSKQQTPPFTEFWIFIRKSNLKTKVKDGIFDRKCPNCGAPIDIDVAGICKYCNANVVNGDYDWVLSEIVQKSEWKD